MQKGNSGFTLIELLIVIAIIAVISGLAVTNYSGVRNTKVFEGEINQIVADLRLTMNRSLAQEDGKQWGIRFNNQSGGNNDFYDVWMGDSYALGTVINHVELNASVQFSDPSSGSTKDVIFSKSTGLPTASSTIGLISSGSNSTATIEVNSQGRIDYSIN